LVVGGDGCRLDARAAHCGVLAIKNRPGAVHDGEHVLFRDEGLRRSAELLAVLERRLEIPPRLHAPGADHRPSRSMNTRSWLWVLAIAVAGQVIAHMIIRRMEKANVSWD
jgi:hypothetical protein